MYMLIEYPHLVQPGAGEPCEISDSGYPIHHRTKAGAGVALQGLTGGKPPGVAHQIYIAEVPESPYVEIQE